MAVLGGWRTERGDGTIFSFGPRGSATKSGVFFGEVFDPSKSPGVLSPLLENM